MSVLHQVVRRGVVEVIYCRGRLVLGETDELRRVARAAIQDIGKVVIHLGDVSSLDSSGLGMLASLSVSARNVSADLKLVALSPGVAEVLRTAKLGPLFDLYPTEEAALEAFATGPSAR